MTRTVALRAIILLLGLVTAAVFLVDWSWVSTLRRTQWTNDATLRGEVTTLAARVEGYVAATVADDFARVRAGDIVVRLEDDDYAASLRGADARLAAAQQAVAVLGAQLRQAEAAVAVARAQVAVSRADLALAERDKARQDQLLRSPAGTRREFDDATAAFTATAEQTEAEQRGVETSLADLDVLRAQIGAAEATAGQAQAERDLAAIRLGWTRITAPEDGTVTARRVREGQYVGANAAVIAFVPDRRWVVANYRESQLRYVRPGQPVRVSVDALPDIAFAGRVDQIGPASQARASPTPPRRDVGTFTRIVQRIPVRIALDAPPETVPLLRPGLNVETGIDTGAP